MNSTYIKKKHLQGVGDTDNDYAACSGKYHVEHNLGICAPG